MTIAVCYVSQEGIVLGADSTTTYNGSPNGNHYYNHGQKLFEIGEDGNFGIVTWGMGGLPHTSYRTLIAKLADDLKLNPPSSVQEVATKWVALFWPEYITNPDVLECRALAVRPAFVQNAPAPAANSRDEADEKRFSELVQNLLVGFCIAGCVDSDRKPAGFQIQFEGASVQPPAPIAVRDMQFWGAPNFILRLFLGLDVNLKRELLASGKWNGTAAEFEAIAQPFQLGLFALPMREAVDLVHSCIAATIKALKFSSLPQICGGPIEIAVITSDRRFRWVRHKPWDSAINEGDIE